MAVISKEEFMRIVSSRIGGDSDTDITDIENITDTVNHWEQQANANPDSEWKQKYEENDREWRARYRERFFTPEPDSKTREAYQVDKSEDTADTDVVDEGESNSYDDLFV